MALIVEDEIFIFRVEAEVLVPSSREDDTTHVCFPLLALENHDKRSFKEHL